MCSIIARPPGPQFPLLHFFTVAVIKTIRKFALKCKPQAISSKRGPRLFPLDLPEGEFQAGKETQSVFPTVASLSGSKAGDLVNKERAGLLPDCSGSCALILSSSSSRSSNGQASISAVLRLSKLTIQRSSLPAERGTERAGRHLQCPEQRSHDKSPNGQLHC